MLWLQREHRNDPSRLPVMALKVVPSTQYGHRMTVGILKCLGFGRLAALLKCKLGSVALVVHGVSLFINLAIFQLAGLATNPALRLGSGRHHLANLHGKRDGDYHRRQRLTVRRPTKSPGEKLERHQDRESVIVIGYFGYFPSGAQGCCRAAFYDRNGRWFVIKRFRSIMQMSLYQLSGLLYLTTGKSRRVRFATRSATPHAAANPAQTLAALPAHKRF